jgi:hypothetical protein
MTVFRPSRKSTKENLDKARAALAESAATLEQLGKRRNEVLLASDDEAEVLAIDKQIEELRRTAKSQSDRIDLLQQQHAQEEAERKAKQKSELIDRVEAKLAERDAAGAELQAAIANADELFRKTIALSKECDSAWPFPTSDRSPCLLMPGSILSALQHEIYRVGSRPLLFGGQDAALGTEASFPGGKSPRLEWAGLPEKIPPLVDVLKQASHYASDIMHARRTPTPPQAPLGAPPERTPAEIRLSELLQEQARLSADISPEGEQRYQAVVADIAALQQ